MKLSDFYAIDGSADNESSAGKRPKASERGFSFSPSRLSLLRDCPKCFWLHYRKNLKRPEGIFPSLPSGMDEIIKRQFDSFRQDGNMPPELQELAGEGFELFSEQQKMDEWRNWRKGLKCRNGDGNELRGAVDEVLQRNGKLAVLDFKTRGFPLKEDTANGYAHQLDAYSLLLRENGFELEGAAYLLFFTPEKMSGNGNVEFRTELVRMTARPENAVELVNEAAQLLSGEMPPADKDCNYCKWFEEARRKIL